MIDIKCQWYGERSTQTSNFDSWNYDAHVIHSVSSISTDRKSIATLFDFHQTIVFIYTLRYVRLLQTHQIYVIHPNCKLNN